MSTLDLIRIVNTGQAPLKLNHAMHGNVSIAPGAQRILPLEYASLHFGNPGAVDDGKNKLRETEYKHARTLWGFYPGIDSEADWDHLRPQYECYDVDEDRRVFFVLDDPDGTKGIYGEAANTSHEAATDASFLEQRIAALEAQLTRAVQMLTTVTAATELPVPAATGTTPDSAGVTAGIDPQQLADQIAAAQASDAQAQRNAERDLIPKPPEAEKVTKDAPRSTRVGRGN